MQQLYVWQLKWSENLSVGIPEIDNEHRAFISLVNALNQAIADRMELPEIQKRMHTILEDAAQHFTLEERLFEQWHYPDASEHAKKHAQLLRELKSIMSRFDSVSVEYEWIAAGLKVKDLLVDHLLIEDMKYRDYCRSLPPESSDA